MSDLDRRCRITTLFLPSLLWYVITYTDSVVPILTCEAYPHRPITTRSEFCTTSGRDIRNGRPRYTRIGNSRLRTGRQDDTLNPDRAVRNSSSSSHSMRDDDDDDDTIWDRAESAFSLLTSPTIPVPFRRRSLPAAYSIVLVGASMFLPWNTALLLNGSFLGLLAFAGLVERELLGSDDDGDGDGVVNDLVALGGAVATAALLTPPSSQQETILSNSIVSTSSMVVVVVLVLTALAGSVVSSSDDKPPPDNNTANEGQEDSDDDTILLDLWDDKYQASTQRNDDGDSSTS